jgi:predicted outer membrane protein
MNSMANMLAILMLLGGPALACVAEVPRNGDGIAARPGEPRTPIDPAGPDVAPKVEGQFTSGVEKGGGDIEVANLGRSTSIEQVLASNLLAANEIVIAVGRLAGERSENAEVKKFSAQLVADHVTLSQELQRIADPEAVDPLASPAETPPAIDPRRSAAKITDTLPHPTTNGETPLNAQTSVTEAKTENGLLSERTRPTPDATKPPGNRLVMRLADVDHRIQEGCTSLLRQQLEQQKGARFDKAYFYVQTTLEAELVSALKLTHEESSGTLGQVAQRGQTTAERHLKEAKDLLEQLETTSKPEGRTDAATK